LTRLRQRKLYKVIKKRTRADHRTKLYLLFVNWLEIRKQKDRRRRRTLRKLYKVQRCKELNLPLTA
jgi:hypothetical protein